MKKKVFILGATGSIGTSTVDIVLHTPEKYEVVGIQAHSDRASLKKLAAFFPNARAYLTSESGMESLLRGITESDADIVVNGIAGASGLMPSVAALESGKDLALANKETIVMAGPLIQAAALKNGAKLLPVDSEHSAVFALIQSFGPDAVSELILTASGGPFRAWTSEQIAQATLEDALRHPTWSMGAKITIDSASLANKGLEVIEACRLFNMPADKVKVVVHPQSLVHSLIRTKDGTLYAQISKPDMRHPIASALDWPELPESSLEILDFSKKFAIDFEPPRREDFPLLGLAYRAAGLGASYPIAFNAANEIAVDAFLHKKIRFSDLARVTAGTLEHDWAQEPASFEEVLDADEKARMRANNIMETLLKC